MKRKAQKQVVKFEAENLSRHIGESVLFVYPGGCVALEKLVATMSALLRSIDIEAFAECTHTQEAAPNIAGFYTHYSEYVSRIVLICTEPVTTEKPHHNPFVFVYKTVIEEQCMFRADRERFLAIYLQENEIENVPFLLKKRSHLIPKDFETFLLALGGTKKWSRFKRDISQLWEGYDQAKEDLCSCINNVAASEHTRCFQSLCKHGQCVDDELSRVISMSELTEQWSCYTRQNSATRSVNLHLEVEEPFLTQEVF